MDWIKRLTNFCWMEKHLCLKWKRQPGFIYSTYESFAQNRERVEKFRKTGNLTYVYQNELDNACFAHDVAYFENKNLTKRSISDKKIQR